MKVTCPRCEAEAYPVRISQKAATVAGVTAGGVAAYTGAAAAGAR